MGLLQFLKKEEIRSDPPPEQGGSDILRASLGETTITQEKAMQIPALKACIETIGNTVAGIPIKLYRRTMSDGEVIVEEVEEDQRLYLLNRETGDTVNAVKMWKAVVEDYFLSSSGANIFANRKRGEFESLHYVDGGYISSMKNSDPIFKTYTITVNGMQYEPYQFIRVLRRTKDGIDNIPIYKESELIMQVVYGSLKFEKELVSRGGNKKGFVKSASRLSQQAIDALKNAWRKFYSTNSENVIVLNDGLDFQESSNTSVEMQLNENKSTNSRELYSLTGVPEDVISGKATAEIMSNYIKQAVQPVLDTIAAAVNETLLLEKEKGVLFFAHDLSEIMKGDIKTRYEAYALGINNQILQPNEARKKEKLKPIGPDVIKLGLDSVLYYPEENKIYTPNTNRTYVLGEGGAQNENASEGQ